MRLFKNMMNRTLLLMLILVSATAAAGAAEKDNQECRETSDKKLAKSETLFAYSIDDKLDALAIFDGKRFLPVDGQEFKHITEMLNLHDGKRYSVLFDAYMTRLGKDRCIWLAHLKENLPRAVSIFATASVPLETEITGKTADLFDSINAACVDQEGMPSESKIPCTKWRLLATSDLNSNGRTEFWFSIPYTWNTGFAVGELSESGHSLDVLSSKCLDCD